MQLKAKVDDKKKRDNKAHNHALNKTVMLK